MKVKELINRLQKYDPEARVYSGTNHGHGDMEILTVFSFSHNSDVILEDEMQFDVANEVREMLEWYASGEVDETSAYQEMVDAGYTPDLLRRYGFDDTASVMEKYCAEHGIE